MSIRALVCLTLVTSLSVSGASIAQVAPSLGGSGAFAALAGTTVTNTGPTVSAGDVGVSPGSAITGFPPGTQSTGTMHVTDAVAVQAQSDLTAAYGALVSQACGTDLTGTDLGGLTLTAGVYCFSSSAQLTGTLTLDAQGDTNAVFIFKMGSTLTTASGSDMVVINGGTNCNAFWQVGSSATLGTGSHFVGNILALTSITMTTNATISGRALARNGAVTLDSNSLAICGAACTAITVSPIAMPAGVVGVPYQQQISAAGDIGPFWITPVSGSVPAGLTLSNSGLVSGTPLSPGVANFAISAAAPDGCGATLQTSITVGTVVAAPTPSQAPSLSLAGMLALMTMLVAIVAKRLCATRS